MRTASIGSKKKKRISVPVPKEHGAWAVLYGSFATAWLAAGGDVLAALLFLATITGVFLSHEPLSRLARMSAKAAPGHRRPWKWWASAYLSSSLASGLLLVLYTRLWLLPLVGVGVAVLLFFHLGRVGDRSERTVGGELLGIMGLTATAPASCYVLTGNLGELTAGLWIFNILYFASAIFYVKMRVSRFAGRPEAGSRTLQCTLYHLGLLPSATLLSWRLDAHPAGLVAFLPVLARALLEVVRPSRHLNLKRIGLGEILYTIWFVLVLGLGSR